jgi:hypothetical protein
VALACSCGCRAARLLHQQARLTAARPAAARHRRAARLKGGGGPQRQRVTIPQGWLEGRDSDEIPAYLDDDACEG